ncbi:MAG: SGNH/GDSL hydrolase family protein [Isosphaeraceae bacterium]|nr:SGNH/GDSL hydrolase family protein [Isosphaeraceae bacterium]
MKRQAALYVGLVLALGQAATVQSGDTAPLADVRRVVFLGDSITYAGQYIEFAEAVLRLHDPAWRCEFLDLGLPSETVSGLSEPGHAGGQFPRPELHERLERVLSQTKPDLVVACYGMNDGIYYPFSEDRFHKYQDGIQRLRDRAKAHGAKVLHLTPPVFDAEPIKEKTLPAGRAEYRQPYVGYDEVLGRYSEWLLARRTDGWNVVDIHGPMKLFLALQRDHDPAYRLAGDGVHANAIGHWIIARALLAHWRIPAKKLADSPSADAYLAEFPHGLELLKIVQDRQRVLKDAWLTATGHKRPGMSRGVPLEAAERQARELDVRIHDLLGRQ